MIRKFSIYFAIAGALIVFGEGIYVHLSFDNLVIRTIASAVICYILGNLLGVITIEALLENQMQKLDRYNEQKKRKREQ